MTREYKNYTLSDVYFKLQEKHEYFCIVTVEVVWLTK